MAEVAAFITTMGFFASVATGAVAVGAATSAVARSVVVDCGASPQARS